LRKDTGYRAFEHHLRRRSHEQQEQASGRNASHENSSELQGRASAIRKVSKKLTQETVTTLLVFTE
jgi:hypothetical protein